MGLELAWLGHSTVVLDVDGTRLITDPLLSSRAGVLRRRGGQPVEATWAGADVVLLSHLHHDHAELASLRRLGDVPVLTAQENAAWLRRHGLDGQPASESTWSTVGRADVVKVRLTSAVHTSRPMPHRPNAANGHLVTAPSGTVWVAGDTELFPALADLPALAGGSIDVAVVPVGGWGPRLSEGHMGPGEAAIACRLVGARWAIPVHWGTLHVPGGRVWPKGWMAAAGPAFALALEREAPECRAVVLHVGESVSLGEDRG